MTLAKSMTVAVTAVVWASAAQAGDAVLHGFGYEVWGAKPPAARTIELKTPPALEITVGGQRIALEHTRLADLVKHFGGAIHSQGDAGDSIDWVCYSDATAGRTFWFASDEMGGSGKAVMSFALAAGDGGREGNGCDKPSAPIGKITLNLPSLGDSVADINRALGTAVDDSPAMLLSWSRPAGKEATRQTWIHYKVNDGRIVGVAADQSTVN